MALVTIIYRIIRERYRLIPLQYFQFVKDYRLMLSLAFILEMT